MSIWDEYTESFLTDDATGIIFDLESDVPDQKSFSDLGQLAMKEIQYVGYRMNKKGDSTKVHRMDVVAFGLSSVFHDVDFIVGHNILRFDIPLMKRLHYIFHPKEGCMIFDTLIMSKILFPKRISHSLESWAPEFMMEKESLSNPVDRCKSDVQITERLFLYLLAEARSIDLDIRVLQLENAVAQIVAEQHEKGVDFDLPKAQELAHYLHDKMQEVKKEVECLLPPFKTPKSKLLYPPKRQFKKDGNVSEAMVNLAVKLKGYIGTIHSTPPFTRLIYNVCGVHTEVPLPAPTDVALNPLSPIDIDSGDTLKDYLLSLGWMPTIWNYKKDKHGRIVRPLVRTTPKIYDENKELCPGIKRLVSTGKIESGAVSALADYFTMKNRYGVLRGWIENSRVYKESRLCPDADTTGAATYRFTHRIVANVPRVTSPFGQAMRGCFHAKEDDRVLVGWDASQLEARIEAHYTYGYDGGKYAKELLESDIHTKNMEAIGLASRDEAKTFKYAVTYGAQVPRLMDIFGWDRIRAELALSSFWVANEALDRLRLDVIKKSKDRGFLVGIDRRRIYTKSEHSALNYLFQSAGAIAMKVAMVIADKIIKQRGLDAYGVIRYHDEEQWNCHKDIADEVGQIGVQSVILAGKYLNLRVPLDAEYKIGKTWADTH